MKIFSPALSFSNNIEITKYFIYEPRFNGTFSRNNLPSIKDGMYAMNLNDKNSKRIHWVSLFIDRNTAVYFDSFGIEKIKDKSITHNIFRIQDNESIMCDFFCTPIIEYML